MKFPDEATAAGRHFFVLAIAAAIVVCILA